MTEGGPPFRRLPMSLDVLVNFETLSRLYRRPSILPRNVSATQMTQEFFLHWQTRLRDLYELNLSQTASMGSGVRGDCASASLERNP